MGRTTGDDLVICRCEEVTRRRIEEAVDAGATDIRGVKVRTRAGMGLCQGKTCERLVRQILVHRLGVAASELLPDRKRPPVRPLDLGLLGRDDDEPV